MEKQTHFWKPNIDRTGRLLRLIPGLLLLMAGVVSVFFWIWWLGLVMAIGGAFMIFEAARGWCLLRACRIKTPY